MLFGKIKSTFQKYQVYQCSILCTFSRIFFCKIRRTTNIICAISSHTSPIPETNFVAAVNNKINFQNARRQKHEGKRLPTTSLGPNCLITDSSWKPTMLESNFQVNFKLLCDLDLSVLIIEREDGRLERNFTARLTNNSFLVTDWNYVMALSMDLKKTDLIRDEWYRKTQMLELNHKIRLFQCH